MKGGRDFPAGATLASLFRVRRRYARSVNLERDLTAPGSLDGYVPTRLAVDAADRIARALLTPGAPRAWTVTGVYGTGKSAFAHFLTALAAPRGDALRAEALRLLDDAPGGAALAQRVKARFPKHGLVRAVVTCQREPLATAVLRALARGLDVERAVWPKWRPAVGPQIRGALAGALAGAPPTGSEVVALARGLADAAESGLVLVLDELGKCLEHAARDVGGADDVYLLQQLAEASGGGPANGSPGAQTAPLAVVGLLHQGFGEYGAGLALERRAEWVKVQGRFEDVAFAEPAEQTLRLVGRAVERRGGPALDAVLAREAAAWHATLTAPGVDRYVGEVLRPDVIARLLPLHPVTALVLPALCARYAQNDRSLFTFLAGQEPHAFGRFLHERALAGPADAASADAEPAVGAPTRGASDAGGNPGAPAATAVLPLQRLDDVYDYFAGIAGQALGFRPHFRRWAEIHAVVSDARALDPDSVAAVKVVAALNLTAASGPLRASRGLTLAALAERPRVGNERAGNGRAADEPATGARAGGEHARWEQVLDGLVERGLLTYRRQLDEYRLWEGSDFDVEAAIRARAARRAVPLADVLAAAVPLTPAVAQRHSYRTGTLRYFEQRFTDDPAVVAGAACRQADSDGVLWYWVGRSAPPEAPAATPDGRPVVLVGASSVAALADAAAEYAALDEIARSEPHLQTDGVARREVGHRLRLARAALDQVVRDALFRAPLACQVAGERASLTAAQLRARLSDVCDAAYPRTPVLWNELVNRRELTSQGARARRELIAAMLARADRPRLGLEGSGPETSMYDAVLGRPGIHRPLDGSADGRWGFGPPSPGSGLEDAWAAVADFCHAATDAPRSVDALFTRLEAPPYGMKRGVLPVLLAAVLVADADALSVYREGSFLPALGDEHFEVLVKHPAKFSVKHFALDGLRAEVFRDLEEVVRAPGAHAPTLRNATILGVVRPLVRFAQGLPPATQRTGQLSRAAAGVRDALLGAREPDTLLFAELPAAAGLPVMGPDEAADPERRAAFRAALLGALRELQTFHERRRAECRRLLHAAFGASADPGDLRADLARRLRALPNRPLDEGLRAFVEAAANAGASETDWLEAVVVVVAGRPLRTWDDADAVAFEGRVADLARRFANLEAVHGASAGRHAGAEVRRLTVTGPDGADRHRVVWVPAERREALAARAGEVAGMLTALPRAEREAVLALLAETLLDGDQAPADAPSLDGRVREPTDPRAGPSPGVRPLTPAHGG